jgi:PrtD family type I secretion system ABC transporter
MPAERVFNKRGPVREAWEATRNIVIHAAGFSAVINVLYLTSAIYMLQVYDRVVPTRGGLTLLFLTVLLLISVATLGALDYLRGRLLLRMGGRLDESLVAPLLNNILKRPLGSTKGALTIRELDGLRNTISGPGIIAILDVPWIPIYVFVAFLLHPILGLLSLLGAGILLAVAMLHERKAKKPIQVATISASQAYQDLDSFMGASDTLRALGMRENAVNRHLRDRAKFLQLQGEVGFTSAGFVSTAKAIRLLLQSVALGTGAYLAIRQQISGGSIFAASLLVGRALAPIEQITGAWRSLIHARETYQTLTKTFDDDDSEAARTWLPDLRGEVVVEQLSVAHPSSQRPVLRNLSFKLEPGTSLGVIGPSGAGKSTLLKALIGSVGLRHGMVRFDGATLTQWPEEQLWQKIGYCAQHPTLFRGSIRDNIARFSDPELTDHQAVDAAVIAAAQLCGAHNLIMRLPDGYQTELGHGGSGLSVGQAQRISLARAFYGDPKIVLLDEPNASIDAEGELALRAALTEFKRRGATVIVVAHRPEILSEIDLLMVLKDGAISAMGPRKAVVGQRKSTGAPHHPAIVTA